MTHTPDDFFPKKVPKEFLEYGSHVTQLEVGSAGKLGGLRLRFSRDEKGQTQLSSVWKKIPLQVLRCFHYDETIPEMAYTYLMNPTGGIVQGDRLRIDVKLESESFVHLTTQAATKIYGMNENYATQMINIELERGSYLEFLPDQIIPYKDSRFYQVVNVRMREKSTFLYSEVITPGRMPDEMFNYDIFMSELSIVNKRDEVVLLDKIVLRPRDFDLQSIGILNGYNILANFYLVSDLFDSQRLEHLNEEFNHDEKIKAAVGALPLCRGFMARVLGNTVREVRSTIDLLWEHARKGVLNKPILKVRK